jgi:hypothetical protein
MTVLNPARANVEAIPVNIFDVAAGCAVSIGYASNAGAFARLAAWCGFEYLIQFENS